MKTSNLIIFFAVVIITVSCKTDPQLEINSDSFTFSENALSKSLIISNKGEKELEWNIENKVAWLSISTDNGTVEAQNESVITLNTNKYNEQGLYNSTFLVSTNGGNKNITVEMELSFTPQIFIGNGIEGSNLNETFESIIIKYGEPEELIHNYVSEISMTEHIAIYHSLGIGFFFYNTLQTINEGDESYAIGLTSPYKGVTEMNIGIETPFANIKKCYDDPDDIYNDDYTIFSYTSKGVNFMSDGAKVSFIWVFLPFTKANKNVLIHLQENTF